MITQAFVLGAGLGTRLRPLTEDLPKPLIPIFQKPLITFALDHLIQLGVKSFVINTHHLAERFADASSSCKDLHVVYVALSLIEIMRSRSNMNRSCSEPAAGSRMWKPLLQTEPFIVYSGDLLTDFSLQPLIDEHFRTGKRRHAGAAENRARRRHRASEWTRRGH